MCLPGFESPPFHQLSAERSGSALRRLGKPRRLIFFHKPIHNCANLLRNPINGIFLLTRPENGILMESLSNPATEKDGFR